MRDWKELEELVNLATEPITKEDTEKYGPTVGDIKNRIAQILGRSIFTHELSCPLELIKEYIMETPGSTFEPATRKLQERFAGRIITITTND